MKNESDNKSADKVLVRTLGFPENAPRIDPAMHEIEGATDQREATLALDRAGYVR